GRLFVPNRFGFGSTAVGIYAPPLGIATGPGYYGPMEDPAAGYGAQVVQPIYVQPMNTLSAAPAAPPMPPPPPMPSVVEVPGGRSELRGPAVTSPYTWVWTPNPPPPPPVAPPPGLVYSPAGPAYPPPSPAFSEDRPPFSSRRLYRWTDDQGVINVTDRLETVPSKYQAQAQTPPS